VDRYLASLHGAPPAYEDPFAAYAPARPGPTYGLSPVARPDTAVWAGADASYGYGHAPAGLPPMGAPPPINTGPGGPRPSTPSGTILPGAGGWDLGRFYNPANDRASGYNGENALGRFNRWVNDTLNVARSRGVAVNPNDVKELARGGIKYAEEHGFGPTGFDFTGAQSNTLNPGQAVEFLAAGGRPNQYHTDARGLTVGPGGDPYQRAADHVTQALTGGATGGQTMATPGYDPGAGGGGVPGLPGAGGGAGGALPDINAGYLLDPQNRAALQAYIASRGGVSPSTHSLLGNYIYDTVAPMFSSALTSLGLDTAGGLQGQLDQWFQQGRGNTLFSGLRNAAQRRLGSGGFASDLAALGDPRAQAGLLNQLINLTTTGQSALHRAATQQSLIDRQRQFELQSALSQDPQQLTNYMTYFQGLPDWQRIVGGGA
jgi:hypothetical protein